MNKMHMDHQKPHVFSDDASGYDGLEGEEAVGEDDEEGSLEGGLAGEAGSRLRTLTRKEVLEILQTTKNFDGLDLRKSVLSKLDLSGCTFRGSNLSYVNFKECNLEGCDFTSASLWNANLEGANLTRANLEDADLDYTKLRGAVLYKANVRRASLPTDLIPREEIMRSVKDGTKIAR